MSLGDKSKPMEFEKKKKVDGSGTGQMQ